MEQAILLDSLSSKDRQSAFTIINQLGNCQDREELNHLLQSALIPLIDCCGAFYARLEGEQNSPLLLDDINQSSLCQHSWKNFLNVATQTQLLANPVTKEKTSRLATDAFCCTSQNCQHCSLTKSCHQVNRCCAIVALFDAHRPTIALYFCRLNPQEQCFSLRDIELLQILRATLLKTIKAVMLQEESLNYQQLMDFFTGHVEPLAVVRDDGVLMYKNNAYNRTVEEENSTFLSAALSQAKTTKFNKNGYHLFPTRLGRRLYDVTLTSVNNVAKHSARLYLLRYSRVSNKNGQSIRQLAKAGLTHRELEIAVLIYQGLSTRNISAQLNLSYHTVRNHIKHIYTKIDVSTRSEMLTWDG